jgi:hypothetical protein
MPNRIRRNDMLKDSQTTKFPKTKTLGWIGDPSWSVDPCAVVGDGGSHHAVLFKTKNDAISAGWPKPKRVEITVRVL